MNAAFVRNGVRYTFCYSDLGKDNFVYLAVSDIRLTWETVYKIPIIENSHFAYKINKKSVSAAGGAYGFFRFIKDCVDNDFNMVSVMRIINAVKNMLPGITE